MSKGNNPAPKNKRFKKGKSGNPKGRPRKTSKPVSTGSVFRRVASELLPIEIGGVQCKIERWHLYVRQIYNMALNKNSGLHVCSTSCDDNSQETCSLVIP
jgi:hypothetical protein